MAVIVVNNSSCRISLNEINFTVTIKFETVKVMFFLERKT